MKQSTEKKGDAPRQSGDAAKASVTPTAPVNYKYQPQPNTSVSSGSDHKKDAPESKNFFANLHA